MKKIFTILTVATILASCSTDNESDFVSQTTAAEKTGTNLSSKSNKTARNQNMAYDTQIIISSQTRGFYENMTIVGRTVSKNSSGIVQPDAFRMSNLQYTNLDAIFYGLSLDLIPYHTPTSTNGMHDGAIQETLKVIHNGVVYVSKTYDAGNPPIVLKRLVNYVKGM